MKFHYHILINPSAGSGNGYKVAERILPVLKNKHIDYTLHYSEYKGHDAEIAETLAKETLIPWIKEEQKTIDTFPLLIIVGGDGTLHQVLDTFYQMEVEFPVAYIPAGSGNDFARGAGLPKNPKKGLQLILAAQSPEKVHIMAYEEKISEKKGIAVNNFGIGLDAAIVHATNHSSTKKRLNKYNLGSFSYLFSILRALFTQKGFPILVDAGGKQLSFSNAFLCTATKHPFFGGGIAIVPTADASKPVIDFVVVERINFFKILWLILLLIQKKQLKSKYFHHYTTNRLRIVSTTPQHGQEDGEEMEKRPFDITITTTKQLFWC
ncbi:YegS//BmrU family lipid kinase [Enterococcus faecium EnGen0313]|uniref:diacylglycerol/lipid kinase family protein n=1 Tax=Enterococcus faecium TaxID=1352 RepID=UPI00032DEC94|nr:diacylglycerol kinase family protein [Enterococcus faecium]EOI36611.1 YegS//BmrU family lipid kinase [Enterococcus faecium EnGen0313]HAQ3751700.1 diacylglycerol kinase family lipid kinase [Enterococcus faecium]HAZ1187770.1 diacylglycerol kinase family lipid kinase [Enterococcus faecium]